MMNTITFRKNVAGLLIFLSYCDYSMSNKHTMVSDFSANGSMGSAAGISEDTRNVKHDNISKLKNQLSFNEDRKEHLSGTKLKIETLSFKHRNERKKRSKRCAWTTHDCGIFQNRPSPREQYSEPDYTLHPQRYIDSGGTYDRNAQNSLIFFTSERNRENSIYDGYTWHSPFVRNDPYKGPSMIRPTTHYPPEINYNSLTSRFGSDGDDQQREPSRSKTKQNKIILVRPMNRVVESPIDLIPARPKRPQTIKPPPTQHVSGTSYNEQSYQSNNNVNLVQSKPNRMRPITQRPYIVSVTPNNIDNRVTNNPNIIRPTWSTTRPSSVKPITTEQRSGFSNIYSNMENIQSKHIFSSRPLQNNVNQQRPTNQWPSTISAQPTKFTNPYADPYVTQRSNIAPDSRQSSSNSYIWPSSVQGDKVNYNPPYVSSSNSEEPTYALSDQSSTQANRYDGISNSRGSVDFGGNNYYQRRMMSTRKPSQTSILNNERKLLDEFLLQASRQPQNYDRRNVQYNRSNRRPQAPVQSYYSSNNYYNADRIIYPSD